MHLAVKASTALFGGNALGMRLPAIASVLVAIVAMWWMLRRWVAPTFAAVGVLAFMATRGFDYAYDARSYAPMMGFAMLALALWVASGDLHAARRAGALAGMAVALALGISSNYYCVLAFFPIALGELLRQRAARRFRMDAWVALALAALPLFAYLPLIRHNIAEFTPHAWNRAQPSMILWSYLELVEGICWPVLFLALYSWWRSRKRSAPSSANPAPSSAPSAFRSSPVPAPELAALGVLILYPFLGFAVAIAGAGMISPRCVAPVCCAFGLAAALLTARLFAQKPRAALATVLALLLWVTIRESICAELLWQQRKSFFALRDQVSLEDPPDPILVADSSFVLPLYFYSSPDVRQRIGFPIDFPAIHRWEKDDSGEQNLWAGRHGIFPFPITALDDSSPAVKKLMVIGRPDGWLARNLTDAGFSLSQGHPGHALDDANLVLTPLWSRLGGVFTPMAHPETRIMIATKPSH